MELDVKPKLNIKKENSGGDSIVNLYLIPPFGTLTLEECEDLFRQRLEALHIIENTETTSHHFSDITKPLREIRSYVYKANCILLRSGDKQQHKLDHFSHMLVRMYCIYNPSLWDWFRTCEKKLLYLRLRDQASSFSGGQLESILKRFNFEFERVLGAELAQLQRENLIGWDRKEIDREITDIFKIKFVHALKFIAKRSISLKDGFAFLTRFEIISVICDVFERHLQSELNYARQHLNTELLQAQQLLAALSMVYLDHKEKVDEEMRRNKRVQGGENKSPFSIDAENMEESVKNHYPPCMRHMHESLMEDHHLKHNARLQYGAFLRTGGVEMEAAIEFWRKEFTKKIPNDKFERYYKYNIRHLYGREGHKKALTCFSCDKIINDNAPGPADKHGCPFKHFDDNHLRTMLTKHGLKEVDIESIFQARRDEGQKMACSHYFKFLKGDLPTEPIKNPIHFYYESMRRAHQLQKQDMEVEEVVWDEDLK